jgi:acetyl esterase/lipase
MCRPTVMPPKESGRKEEEEVHLRRRLSSYIFSLKFLSIVILLLAILIGFFCKSNSTFEGGPHNLGRPIPKEAVPLWQTSELNWKVRFFLGYIFDKLVPVGSLVKCPTVVDWSNEQEAEEAKSCMNPIRSTIESGDDSVDLNALFDVQSVDIDRGAGGGTDDKPLRVTLLKKKRSTSAADDNSDTAAVDDDNISGPLILYMHGGGFTVRGGKNALAAQMFSSLLQKAEEDEDDHGSFMNDAVWAVVEYRLAPEYIYPAATDDCLLALNHLVNEMNLGGKGIHISGNSAGATLAMEVTLKSIDMNIDSFFVDEPMVPLPSKNENGWSFDSSSFRRYSHARIPPVSWLEWSLKAMTGTETIPSVESNIPYGMITTNVDITGGSLEVANWKHAFEHRNSTLPTLFIVTANGCPLKDGGVYFKQVYEQVIEQVEGEKLSSERTEIKHFETKTGHTLFYALEPSVFQQMMTEWYTVMRKGINS